MGLSEDLVYLRHISDAIVTIESYVSRGGRELFETDRAIQDGIIRQLEIVGEAGRNISDFLKERHMEVPWRKIVGARDKLIHGYMGIDLDRVWLMATVDVPRLKQQVEKILTDERESEI